MSKNREPGFYWVRHRLSYSENYETGRFDEGGGWLLTGSDEFFHDSELHIDERRIVREEPSK